eukprot:gnl/TRDRNA2_/TRDRNA2_199474_c0_seq1.p1 gnl/TRDRNA2_/TRDRNA2_199474_c0~~gnl/TRDRNA2_/TRDRNA2_199474_c0_seq1.p1  ORF type:complete len:606 (-),score=105.02 gnl/TRDRNA2_/TRDRNA2_199474_c0_seq1:154-1773(-)
MEVEAPKWASTANSALLYFYIVELLLRMFVFRRRFFKDPFRAFDLLVVSVDVAFLFLGALNVPMPSVAILRIFRLLKLARAVKFMHIFPELSLMVRMLAGTVRSIFWGLILVFVTLIIWSILASMLIHPINRDIAERGDYEGSCERCPRAFESVFNSLVTFLQHIIAGDSWGNVSVPIVEEAAWTAIFFLGVLASVQLAILNILLAAIVDSAMQARLGNQHTMAKAKEREQQKAKDNLVKICATLDKDNSGNLTLDELLEGLRTVTEFADTLRLMDIGEEDMGIVFHMIDADGSGEASYHEFVEELYKMTGHSVHTMVVFIKAYVAEIRLKLAHQLGTMQTELALDSKRILAHLQHINGEWAPSPSQVSNSLSPEFLRQSNSSLSLLQTQPEDAAASPATEDKPFNALTQGCVLPEDAKDAAQNQSLQKRAPADSDAFARDVQQLQKYIDEHLGAMLKEVAANVAQQTKMLTGNAQGLTSISQPLGVSISPMSEPVPKGGLADGSTSDTFCRYGIRPSNSVGLGSPLPGDTSGNDLWGR